MSRLLLIIVFAAGALAFFHRLDVSLMEGSEGLYAHITREMLETRDFLHLSYLGEPYGNKPPLFFWILALSIVLFGETETALRLPGALFSIGTMAVTYRLGALLFSRTAGLWAALVVATTHVFLWYGRRVLFDAGLTFGITLALFAWVRAQERHASPAWYVVSFLAMAFGTMLKALHGFVLPAVVMLLHAVIRKDARPLKEPAFWLGAALSASLVVPYYWVLGEYLRSQTLGQNVFQSLMFQTGGENHPFYWYLGVLWFDFFPWALLIPLGLAFLWSRRPLADHPPELFVTLWVVAFLLVISLAPNRREPYLMPIVPGLGLMVGFCYQRLFRSAEPLSSAHAATLRLLFGCLALLYAAGLIWGPSLLQRRWGTMPEVFPSWFVLSVLLLCVVLLYTVMAGRFLAAFRMAGLLAGGFMMAMVHFILPALDRAHSPKQISEEITAFSAPCRQPVVLYMPGWPSSEDVVYYLTRDPCIARMKTSGDLFRRLFTIRDLTVITEKPYLARLEQDDHASVEPPREFRQRRKENYYVTTVHVRER